MTNNPWIIHVKEYASSNGITYSQALKDPKCKGSYKKMKKGDGIVRDIADGLLPGNNLKLAKKVAKKVAKNKAKKKAKKAGEGKYANATAKMAMLIPGVADLYMKNAVLKNVKAKNREKKILKERAEREKAKKGEGKYADMTKKLALSMPGVADVNRLRAANRIKKRKKKERAKRKGKK